MKNVLEQIDGEITMSGIFEAYNEEEAQKLWVSLLIEEAKKKGIDDKIIKAYIEKN
jgi:hypothetical protein